VRRAIIAASLESSEEVMLVDIMVRPASIAATIGESRRADNGPYDGLWMPEAAHDPFVSLAFVAEHTERIAVGTAIAVALARSPMTLAYSANDLQLHAEGRFILGLGSQVKAHVERRFSMPWSDPAARMRELVLALHAIWDSWRDGSTLDFRGDYYQHTLMTPFFSPGPNPYGSPEVFLAAVGPAMTKVAGQVADGLMVHPFTTARYLREVTMPALVEAASLAGRPTPAVQFSPIIVTATDDGRLETAIKAIRSKIAFYASTPEYHRVLELHGWDDLGKELWSRSKLDDPDRWTKMADLIDDDVLHAFAVVSRADSLAKELRDRFDGVVDRISVHVPPKQDATMWDEIAAGLRQRSFAAGPT
jgi:probable F420-dependent oxidoreductase